MASKLQKRKRIDREVRLEGAYSLWPDAELAVSSPAVAETIASTRCA